MAGSTKIAKTKRIDVRLTPKQHTYVYQRAKAWGISLPDYIRKMVEACMERWEK
jgi:predicted HicB family RNase H-like nuclease